MFEALEKQTIDLVILDVMLQGEDGFRLCQRLRATSRICRTSRGLPCIGRKRRSATHASDECRRPKPN
jgi:CheY-like chemotaxis protein